LSIHDRKTSTGKTHYVVRWRDPRSRERTFHRKIDADRFERSVRHQVDTGSYRDPRLSRVTFKEWHDRWWPTIEASDRAPNTIAQYETVLRLHVLPHFARRRLGDLRRIDFEEWLTELRSAKRCDVCAIQLSEDERMKDYKWPAEGLSSSTLHAARTAAGMALASAVDSGVIPANPIRGLRLIQGTSRTQQALTAEQVEALAKAIDPWWRPLVLVLAYCGIRPGEAAALRLRHLDDLGRLTIEGAATEHRGRFTEGDTKTRRARVVQVPSSVLKELRAHIRIHGPSDPEAPIFVSLAGDRFRLSNWRQRVWFPAVSKSKMPDWATPYTLRHTAASLMAQQGVPVTTAAAALGHDPAVFLRTYAHLYPGDLSSAAKAMETARADARSGRKRPVAMKGPAGISRGKKRPSRASHKG